MVSFRKSYNTYKSEKDRNSAKSCELTDFIGMCQIYEQKLKIMNADAPQITYDLADLITYLDSLKDLCCLTYNDIQKVYIPHGRDWIKSKIYMSLKKQAK